MEKDYKKKYKEAFKRAEECYFDGLSLNQPPKAIIEEIFPELKYSRDEEIRNGLLSYFKERRTQVDDDELWYSEYSYDKIISWLEKQKLLKSWNSINDVPAPIQRDILGWYRLSDGKLDNHPHIVYFTSEEEVKTESERDYRLAYWTELPPEDFEKLYWYQEKQPTENNAHTEDSELSDFESKLFTAFSYFWQEYMLGHEVNVKELIKEQSAELLEAANAQNNPQWTEEDDVHAINTLSAMVANNRLMSKDDAFKLINWLGSLKCRMMPKQEWTDGDNVKLDEAIRMIESNGNWVRSQDAVNDIVTWLKSVKTKMYPVLNLKQDDSKFVDAILKLIKDAEDENHWNCVYSDDKEVHFDDIRNWLKSIFINSSVPNLEWTDEDEKMSSFIVGALDAYYRVRKEKNNTYSQEQLDAAVNWLHNRFKSIKPQQELVWTHEDEINYSCFSKVIALIENSENIESIKTKYTIWLTSLRKKVKANSWKPSEEQMDILDMVLTNEAMDDNVARVLRELKEQLKKL